MSKEEIARRLKIIWDKYLAMPRVDEQKKGGGKNYLILKRKWCGHEIMQKMQVLFKG